MDQHTKTISTRLDAMGERPDLLDRTLTAFVALVLILVWFGIGYFLADRVLANTAATILAAEQQAQAYREGW